MTTYAVGLHRGAGAPRAAEYKAGDAFHGGRVIGRNQALGFLVVDRGEASDFESRARRDRNVRYVEPDPERDWIQFTPDDPEWNNPGMYGARQIRANVAWDRWMGDTAAAVCIVDSGVRYTHEDLGGTRWLGGYDYVNDDADPWDDNGHGTHVAGTAAATINSGRGTAGIGNVGIYGVKVLNSAGSGTATQVASGITWCADNGGTRPVISLSLGSTVGSTAIGDAVEYAWSSGALVVAAAGNDGPCTNCINYPARFVNAIAVTCTTSTEALCSYSSTGPEAELSAPGDGILSTCYSSDTSYCTKSGTSMSTPHVSGAAALAWSRSTCRSNAEVRQALQDTAQDLGAAGRDAQFGYGRVDAEGLRADLACFPLDVLASRGAGRGEIDVSWEPTVLGTDVTFAAFDVLRSETADEGYSVLATVGAEARTYTDTGVTDGATRYYRVTGRDVDGMTFDSSTHWATTRTTPEAPRALVASPGLGRGEIELTWQPPTDDGGLPITGYDVYRIDTDGLEFPAGEAAGTTFLDAGLEDDTTYAYEVTASNVAGEGPRSARALAQTRALPDAPPDLRSARGPEQGQVTLAWLAAPGLRADDPIESTGANAAVGTLITFAATASDPFEVTYRYCYFADTNGRSATIYTRVDGATLDSFSFFNPYTGGGTCQRDDPTTYAVRSFMVTGGVSSEVRFDFKNGDFRLVIAEIVLGNAPDPSVTEHRVYRTNPDSSQVLAGVVPGVQLSFTDLGLPDATEFAYEVSSVNVVGEGPRTSPVTGSTPSAPVTTPTGSDAQRGPLRGGITVDWGPPADDGGLPITEYRIYRTGPDGIEIVAGVAPAAPFIDGGLADATTYAYRLTAVNAVGEGPPTNPIQASTPTRPVTAPATLEAERGPGRGEISASWAPPADDGGTAITEYRIYRTGADGIELLAGVAPEAPFVDTGLADATTYTYRLTAVNAVGEGPPTNAIQATTPTLPVTAPQTLQVKRGPGRGEISASWTPPGDDGGLTILTYRLYRTGPDGQRVLAADVPALSTTDAGLADETSYTYEVSATNAIGEGPLSLGVAATTVGAPDPPQDVDAQRGTSRGSIAIDWFSRTIEREGPIQSTGNAAAEGTLLTISATRDGPIQISYRYCYWADTTIRNARIDTRFDGQVVDSLSFKTPSTGSGSCSVENPGTYALRTTTVQESVSTQIRLDYKNGDFRLAIADVRISEALDFPILEFRIYRTNPDDSESLAGIIGGDAAAFTDSGLADNATYGYQAAAVNVVGEGARSPFSYATTAGPPGPPRDLAATRGPGRGNLSLVWSAPLDDGGLAVTAYGVYRTGPDGMEAAVGSVPAAQTSFEDRGLADNTLYSYRLSSVNDVGEGARTTSVTEATALPPWPSRADAWIRPGIVVDIDGRGPCTANFLFWSPANTGLYLGAAAHCVGKDVGAMVRLSGPGTVAGQAGPVIGTVAYSSFTFENVDRAVCQVVFVCPTGPGNAANDFALIELNKTWMGQIHPAVLHYGGPTGLEYWYTDTSNHAVISYGNSLSNGWIGPLNWKEGIVRQKQGPWLFHALMATPDAGSLGGGVLHPSGRAIGIMNTFNSSPPGTNGVTYLATALAFANTRTAWRLELQTWALLDPLDREYLPSSSPDGSSESVPGPDYAARPTPASEDGPVRR